MRRKHEGIRYPCDQCEYSAGAINDLNRHKGVKHEVIRIPCDQCEYSAGQLAHLKRHKKLSMKVLNSHSEQLVNNVIILGVHRFQ